jgi:cytosol alanyl aminopeptidase
MRNRTLSLAFGALLVSCAAAPPDSVRPSAAPPAAVADAPPFQDPPKLRLPDTSFPTRYDAELTLDPARDGFTGVVSIHLAARRSTRLVWLHAQDITIRAASFSRDGAAYPANVLPGPAPFVGFVLPTELSPEKPGVLRIEYEGKIDGERPQGVYSVSEGEGADNRYVYSLFEPLDARRAFPCFDEPGYKVPWKLAIRVRKEHTAFSNAEVVSETDEGAMKKIAFAETPPIPSYLVAFMAGPFETVDAGTVGREKKRLRFIVPRGRGAETRYAAQVTPAIIAQLEDYFGMPYPYSKLDVAVVPRYEGTMEHPGIVALGQPLTLIKPDEEGLSRKQRYADIASHELAHYWFGDYVTMKWWDDTWLNESFATWMDVKITDAVEPSWKFGRAGLERSASAMSADKLASAKKMRQPVESVEDILNAFDGALTYNKGASVIAMMEHAVTPPVWQKTVRRYMEKHAWRTTAADDFIAVVEEVAGAEAAASFASFLNQPGVPLVTVAPVCGASPPKLRLEQQRFLPTGTTAQGSLWKVPVCVRYGAGAEKGRLCTFLSEKTREVSIPDLAACPSFVVPNEGGLGYYVSGYSAEALDRFSRRDKASFTVEERAALIRDVGFLVSNGSVPLGRAMELVPDAVATGDKTTLESVQSILQNIHAADLPEPLYLAYKRFARKAFAPRARALGFSPKAGEDPGTVEMRTTLLFAGGVMGEDPELLETGKRLADRWLDDRRSLPPDVVRSVLALAAHGNDKALFDKLLRQAKAAPDRNEKNRLIASLGRFSDKALAERALGLVLSSELELNDSLSILFTLLSGRKTRDLAYAFVKLHFDELLKRSSGFDRPALFRIPDVYCDAAHRADAEAFFGPRAKTVDGAGRVLANSLESISLCEAGRKAALPSLEAFLKKY